MRLPLSLSRSIARSLALPHHQSPQQNKPSNKPAHSQEDQQTSAQNINLLKTTAQIALLGMHSESNDYPPQNFQQTIKYFLATCDALRIAINMKNATATPA